MLELAALTASSRVRPHLLICEEGDACIHYIGSGPMEQ